MAKSTRPIRFGVQPGMKTVPWSAYAEVWRRLDSMGFDTSWVSDHLLAVSVGAQLTAGVFDGWSLQAGLAAVTNRIRIGCLVTGNTYRHPAVLAKIATTVDHISGGRLDFGIGAGWSREDHDPFAIPFYTFGERAQRLDEALEVITRLWTQEKATFQGKYYQVSDAPAEPKPVQKPRPPIMVGGTGERTLKTVARYADQWNGVGSPTMIQERTAILDRHCRDIGRNPAEIERSVLISAILADPSRRDSIRQRRRESYSPARAQHGGQFVKMNEDEAVNAILLGSPQEIQEQIGRFIDVGVTHFILTVPYPVNYQSLERISKEVIQAFK